MRYVCAMWLFVGVLTTSTAALSAETAVAIRQLPRIVLRAVNTKFPDAKMLEAMKDVDHQGTSYDVLIVHKSQKINVTVLENGDVDSFEKEITVKDLPAAVVTAIAKAHPKSVYKKIEACYEVDAGKDVFEHYAVDLETAGKKQATVNYNADGTEVAE